MRNLIVLSACCFVIATAGAKDPPASPAAATPAATKPAAAVPAPVPASATSKAAPAKPSPRPLTAAEQRIVEEQAELDLQARIAARIAEMRANQQQRAAAAAKARKVSETKKKKEVVAVKPPPPANGTHWAYDGEFGPGNWGKINSKWAQCGAGGRQSPIDIRDGMKVELEKLAFDYKPSSFSVIDTGHTIQVNVAGGNYLTVQNRSYELLQFHFHRPSEERINGKSFEMVVHLVHKDVEGKLAVLAVLLERGAAQNMIQTVWNNLPLEKNDTVQPSVVLDVADVLPERRDYYTYMGSLTTPPCTEGVLWLVMKQPMQASPQQMAIFSRLYPFNARPVQANSGRVIKESN